MGTMRILVVDNQGRARHSMKALLSTWRQVEKVYEAGNGAEAIEMAGRLLPDVILMDARMPNINGLEATRLIKSKWPQIKVIILSMYTDLESQALSAGADSFVSKSDAPDKLREILMNLIG